MAAKRRRDRGDGSLFPRTRTLPSGLVVKDWVAVRSLGYDETGKRIRRTFYGRTKAAVQLKVEQARAAAGGTLAPLNVTTVKDYFESWLADLERSRSPLTVTGYRQRLNLYAFPNIGGLRLDQLDSDRISRLYGTLYERGVSSDNVEKLHKALRRAFNVAIGRGLITKNPALHVERKSHKQAKRASIDAKDVKRFFEAIRGHRFEAMFRLQVMSMMRPGEIFALAWADVLLDKKLVDVRHNLENDNGKLSPGTGKSGFRTPNPSRCGNREGSAGPPEADGRRGPRIGVRVRYRAREAHPRASRQRCPPRRA